MSNGKEATLKKTIMILTAVMILALLCGCTGLVISFNDGDGLAAEGSVFSVRYDGNQGNVYSEATEGNYADGTEIAVHAVPVEDASFYCWTADDTLENGGEPVSYAMDYTFTLSGDTRLFGNFRDHDSVYVLYHGNGGTAVETGEEELWNEFSLAYYLYPNTLPDMGHFEREGYTLIGYNTEPDGSGEFYNVGGKAFEDTDHVIELYCVWSQQSPVQNFTYEYNAAYDGWFVTGVTGESMEEISIPTEYSNQPVVGIATGALTGADMTTLVLPSCLKVIEDFSCNDCPNLAVMYLYDSLVYLSDDSFDGDSQLNTVYFSAATNPKFSNWFNNHSKKVEILNYWKDVSPKMICLGGSSTTYAVDAELLESLLDRDYLVLNYGSNGANLFNMTSEWAMHFMNEGDMLLHITEYSFWQLGGVECRWESFRSFESCYNIYSWITASQYTELYNSFRAYLEARMSMADMTYEDYVSNLAPNGYYNNHGTLNVATRANGSSTFWSGRNIYFSGDWLYPFMVYYTNVQYYKINQMGCDVLLAFTPLNRNSLYDYQTDEAMDDFEDYLSTWLTAPLISDLQENIFEPEVFFDDDYHLCAEYRTIYTTQLAEDINAYWASLDESEAGE